MWKSGCSNGLMISDARVRQPTRGAKEAKVAPSTQRSPGRVTATAPYLETRVTFTGKLQVARDVAAAQAALAGADVQDNVTKRTTILVVGDQDLRLTKGAREEHRALDGPKN